MTVDLPRKRPIMGEFVYCVPNRRSGRLVEIDVQNGECLVSFTDRHQVKVSYHDLTTLEWARMHYALGAQEAKTGEAGDP